MINLGDLSTIATLDINLTIIVLRDDAYGMISWKQTEA
jgi:thiamine pyrophosphate-dependent acetolactate synthase large subunit-like protein